MLDAQNVKAIMLLNKVSDITNLEGNRNTSAKYAENILCLMMVSKE